mmetsp:Transcript_68136/g.208873  ORF Transcript_68136/g.208873 Transcript_68136/m.208873 type:complete len:314 (+) Transcript_68136:613-1554(+)
MAKFQWTFLPRQMGRRSACTPSISANESGPTTACSCGWTTLAWARPRARALRGAARVAKLRGAGQAAARRQSHQGPPRRQAPQRRHPPAPAPRQSRQTAPTPPASRPLNRRRYLLRLSRTSRQTHLGRLSRRLAIALRSTTSAAEKASVAPFVAPQRALVWFSTPGTTNVNPRTPLRRMPSWPGEVGRRGRPAPQQRLPPGHAARRSRQTAPNPPALRQPSRQSRQHPSRPMHLSPKLAIAPRSTASAAGGASAAPHAAPRGALASSLACITTNASPRTPSLPMPSWPVERWGRQRKRRPMMTQRRKGPSFQH